jgi:hypothetical protein
MEHDTGGDQGTLNVRFMLNAGTATGGDLTLAMGFDATGAETFRINYHATTGVLVVALAIGPGFSRTIPLGLAWRTLELGIDTADGGVGLGVVRFYIDGVLYDTATGTFGALATRKVQLGAIFKESAVVGDLYLDEWAMSTGYIGTVAMPYTETHAGDPKRWVALYNTNTADSVTWAESYRVAHGLGFSNMLGIDATTNEMAGQMDWETIRDAVAAHIANDFPAGQIVGILIGYGMPGTANCGPTDLSIASLLADLAVDTQDIANPYYEAGLVDTADMPDRITLAAGTRYLVGEINAPTLGEAIAMTTKSQALSTTAADGQSLTTLVQGTDVFAALAGDWPSLDLFAGTTIQQQIRLGDAAGFDGSTHGNAIELTDATAGDFSVAGQQKAILITTGDNTADLIRNN